MSDIHPTAVVDSSAELGEGVRIGPYCVIGAGARLGTGTHLHSHVVIDGDTWLGDACIVYPFACLGTRTQDKKYSGGQPGVRIGERVTIREYVTVNAGTQEGSYTRVGSDCLLMAYAHVAHNCEIGDHAMLVNAATLAGEVVVEPWATIGALTGVHQFTRIGTMAFIGGCSRVVQDIPPFMIAVGNPIEVRGPNSVGLERRGVSAEARRELRQAYRLLYRENLGTSAAVARMRAENLNAPEVQRLIEFVESSTRGLAK